MKTAMTQLDASAVEVLPRPTPRLDRDELDAFEELVHAFREELEHLEAFSRRSSTYFQDEFVREDEFTCHGCNLILHRRQLGDEERILCRACAGWVGVACDW